METKFEPTYENKERTCKLKPTYDIGEYVREAINDDMTIKNYLKLVGGRKILYSMVGIDSYKYQPEEPPFSPCILAAYVINGSDANEITMPDIVALIQKYFPYYKRYHKKGFAVKYQNSEQRLLLILTIEKNARTH